jgi:hypothetical protein
MKFVAVSERSYVEFTAVCLFKRSRILNSRNFVKSKRFGTENRIDI